MNPFSHFAFSPLVQELGGTLLHSLWQGALVAALLALVLRQLRQGSANARYLAACMALIALGACSAVTLIVLHNAPGSPARNTQAIPLEKAAGALTAASSPAAATPYDQPGVSASFESERAVRPSLSWGPAWLLPGLVATWLLGVVCLSVRLLGNWLHVQWLTRSCMRPVGRHLQEQANQLARRMGITRPVRVVETARIQAPVVVGWLQATVLFPASVLTGLPPRHLEAILAHELAHIRRHDYLTNLLQTVLETLLFYHPATWWISEQIRNERENCCDDVAVQICGDRMVYARALAALEDLRHGPASLAMAADGGHLLHRIRRIVGKPPSQGRLSPISMGGVAVVSLASFAFLVWWTPALVQASGRSPSDGVDSRQAASLPSVDPVSPDDIAERSQTRRPHTPSLPDPSSARSNAETMGTGSALVRSGARQKKVSAFREAVTASLRPRLAAVSGSFQEAGPKHPNATHSTPRFMQDHGPAQSAHAAQALSKNPSPERFFVTLPDKISAAPARSESSSIGERVLKASPDQILSASPSSSRSRPGRQKARLGPNADTTRAQKTRFIPHAGAIGQAVRPDTAYSAPAASAPILPAGSTDTVASDKTLKPDGTPAGSTQEKTPSDPASAPHGTGAGEYRQDTPASTGLQPPSAPGYSDPQVDARPLPSPPPSPRWEGSNRRPPLNLNSPNPQPTFDNLPAGPVGGKLIAYEVGGRGQVGSERPTGDMGEAPPPGQMRTGQDPAMLRSSAEGMEGPVIETVSAPPTTASMPPHSSSAMRQITWEQRNIAMAKVIAVLDLQMPAGKATLAPPVGTTLGPYGINMKALIQIYNEKTAAQVGTILPVEITIFEDRSFTITTKTPLPETPPALDVAGESTEDTAAL